MAFTFYRDLPPMERSLETAYRAFKTRKNGAPPAPHIKADGRFRSWSGLYRWVARAQAWDREKDRLNRETELETEREAVAAMRKRHISIAQSMQNLAANKLKKMIDNDGAELSISGVAKFFNEGTKLERLSRGEPDTIIGGDPVAKLAEMLGVHPSELRDTAGGK